jgi:hypothetical protein
MIEIAAASSDRSVDILRLGAPTQHTGRTETTILPERVEEAGSVGQ